MLWILNWNPNNSLSNPNAQQSTNIAVQCAEACHAWSCMTSFFATLLKVQPQQLSPLATCCVCVFLFRLFSRASRKKAQKSKQSQVSYYFSLTSTVLFRRKTFIYIEKNQSLSAQRSRKMYKSVAIASILCIYWNSPQNFRKRMQFWAETTITTTTTKTEIKCLVDWTMPYKQLLMW